MEFLIKRTDGDWFNLHSSQFDEALCPSSYPSNRVQGWGSHRIEIDGCQVSFSYEDPGILVCFDCPGISPEKASSIVDEIPKKVSAVTGQSSMVIQL